MTQYTVIITRPAVEVSRFSVDLDGIERLPGVTDSHLIQAHLDHLIRTGQLEWELSNQPNTSEPSIDHVDKW